MGKNAKKKSRSSVPAEEHLIMPIRTSSSPTPIVDTHTHILSTFQTYRAKYKEGKHATVFDFIKAVTVEQNVQSIVDVWCEAPVEKEWKELADSAVGEEERKEKWGGVEYWFVMGIHNANKYDDAVESTILEAMTHPRCVGWGEIGLDYHYDNSPRDLQQAIFQRQLEHAVRLGKPLTIHTREAEEDTERIMKAVVPKEHKIHIHCFTDTPEFAGRLLEHFPNLYIGVTGVITYSTNLNTSATLKNMIPSPPSPDSPSPNPRILLETDGPYMVPANLYASPHMKDVSRLPLCHTGMIPWTAEFAAGVFGEGWDAERVLKVGRENAAKVYGV
ncbi:Metallo-dependent hydrolase [Pterulicium gracile]|uniref:Metallo-dependent hydrolase n=1 Tax=Pterulicium gracile TaxID=1884261 RepID=A0A5C3QP61_9AGAR|nr:Metallo-dependent hydrolase [Pterula gracilis]